MTSQSESGGGKGKGHQRKKIGWKDPGQQWEKGWADDGEGELGCTGSFLRAVGSDRIQEVAAAERGRASFCKLPQGACPRVGVSCLPVTPLVPCTSHCWDRGRI